MILTYSFFSSSSFYYSSVRLKCNCVDVFSEKCWWRLLQTLHYLCVSLCFIRFILPWGQSCLRLASANTDYKRNKMVFTALCCCFFHQVFCCMTIQKRNEKYEIISVRICEWLSILSSSSSSSFFLLWFCFFFPFRFQPMMQNHIGNWPHLDHGPAIIIHKLKIISFWAFFSNRNIHKTLKFNLSHTQSFESIHRNISFFFLSISRLEW